MNRKYFCTFYYFIIPNRLPATINPNIKFQLPAVIVLAGVLVLFAGILITGRLFAMNLDVYVAPTSIIKGVYSVDDGPWKEIDIKKPIDERFHKIVFKGHLIDNGYYLRELDISSKMYGTL